MSNVTILKDWVTEKEDGNIVIGACEIYYDMGWWILSDKGLVLIASLKEAKKKAVLISRNIVNERARENAKRRH